MRDLVTIGNLLGSDKNEADFALSREILMWGYETQHKRKFRFTDLGNWLIENHRPFKEEFAGSHTRRSYRLHSKRSYIKSRMEDLVRLGLIEKHGTAKAEKNQSDIQIYKFTLGGVIIGAILIASKTSQASPTQNSVTARAVLLISAYLKHNKVSTFLFLSNFFAKCEQEQYYGNDGFVHMLRVLFSYLYHVGEFNLRQARLAIMCIPTLYEELEGIFFQTLNELDEQTRKLLLLQFKMDIETNYTYEHMDPESVREWELMRFENIQNYSKVTLSGYCKECKLSYPFVMDIFSFIRLPDIFGVEHGINPDTRRIEESTAMVQKIDCFKCGKKNCLVVIPNWYAVEKVHPLVSSWYATRDPNE
jgi:hypothetical protein